MTLKSSQANLISGTQPSSSRSIYTQPDIFEVITYLILIAFFVAVFQNVTYIGSPNEAERILATQYLAIAALGTAGLGMRAIYDHLPVRDARGTIVQIGLTETIYETKNWSSLGKTGYYFALAFGVQMIMSFLIMSLPLSIFEGINTQMLVLGTIAAVGEELFFSYFLTGLLIRTIKWGVIPLVSLIFVWYHFVVYQTLTHLLMVGVMRLVYATVYLFSRRLSSVTLAHILNNFLVSIRI